MISSRLRVIIVYQPELMHTARIFFPQLHIGRAFGKDNQVKTDSRSDSYCRPAVTDLGWDSSLGRCCSAEKFHDCEINNVRRTSAGSECFPGSGSSLNLAV